MLGGALALLLIAGCPEISAGQACTVVGVNAVSALGMVVPAFSGLIDLTGLGIVFMLVGALVRWWSRCSRGWRRWGRGGPGRAAA